MTSLFDLSGVTGSRPIIDLQCYGTIEKLRLLHPLKISIIHHNLNNNCLFRS